MLSLVTWSSPAPKSSHFSRQWDGKDFGTVRSNPDFPAFLHTENWLINECCDQESKETFPVLKWRTTDIIAPWATKAWTGQACDTAWAKDVRRWRTGRGVVEKEPRRSLIVESEDLPLGWSCPKVFISLSRDVEVWGIVSAITLLRSYLKLTRRDDLCYYCHSISSHLTWDRVVWTSFSAVLLFSFFSCFDFRHYSSVLDSVLDKAWYDF